MSTDLREGRLPVLDGMRAISILWVLALHLPIPHDLLPGYLEALRGRGELGVEIFFALSGFLVTRSLEECRSSAGRLIDKYSAAKDFALRRIAKIWPPYFFSLFIIAIAIFCFESGSLDSGSRPHILWSIPTFLANYAMPGLPNLPHIGTPLTRSVSNIWSVCFEEQFYFVLLLLFLWSEWNYWKWMFCLGIFSIAWRLIAIRINPTLGYQSIHMMTHYRWDAIAWGCAAWMKRDALGAWISRSRLTQAAIVAFTVFAIVFFRHREPITALDASLAFAMTGSAFALLTLMLCYTQSPARRLLECRPLVWIGESSYEIYLIHGLAIWAVNDLITARAVFGSLVAVALSLLMAGIFHRVIGDPARKWILHFGGTRGTVMGISRG